VYTSFPLVLLACQAMKSPVMGVSAKENYQVKGQATLSETLPVMEEAKEPTVIAVGDNKLSAKELGTIINTKFFEDSLSKDSVLLETIQDLKILAEAKSRGYDTTQVFREEMESYRSILAESYLNDSTLVNGMVKELYTWMKEEVRIAHIMYKIPEFADSKDTLVIYQKLIDIREKAKNGEDFANLAKEFSQDTETNSSGGDLGWFTPIRFQYPIEKVAFTTAVGAVSMPVRTKNGFHLIKVLGRRPASGMVLVQQILKSVPQNASPEFITKAKNQIDSLSNLLKKGVPFEDICKKYSDDNKNRNNGGLLAPFGVGGREELAFEQAAFALKVGEVSAPVRTSIGWHLIKLVKRIPLDDFAKIKSKLKDKVLTDSRGDFIKENAYQKLKKQLNFSEEVSINQQLSTLADSSLLKKKWKFTGNTDLLQKTLFSLGKHKVLLKEFVDFVEDRQTFDRIPANLTPLMLLRKYYQLFQNNILREYADGHLEENDPEFKQLMQAYRIGLLKTNLLNDLVYEKAISDTLGQRAIYEKSLSKYSLPERVSATVISSKDAKTIFQIKNILEKGKPYHLARKFRNPILFKQGESIISAEDKKNLFLILEIMRKNAGYLVEIGGHADFRESENISAERIEKVKAFLLDNGLPNERIIENDYVKTKPLDKFDWQKNQRVEFIFFSNFKKDIEKIFNTTDPKMVQIEEGYFQRGQNKYVDLAKWEPGSYSTAKDGLFVEVLIEAVEPARSKTLRECRGAVIAEYQKYLENKFYKELDSKYSVQMNEQEVQKIIGTKTN